MNENSVQLSASQESRKMATLRSFRQLEAEYQEDFVDPIDETRETRRRRHSWTGLFRTKLIKSNRYLYTEEDQFEIEWANLSLQMEAKKWEKKIESLPLIGKYFIGQEEDFKKDSFILRGVDGRIKSGEITAVLGPSGAGKTSLLNSLFSKYRNIVKGTIKVSGAPIKKHLTVCTIPQNDHLIGYLTTEEALWFASRLKNTDKSDQLINHDKNIERVIELLGLQRCRQTRINKLSGGQHKRVSIAQEMLSSPDILVLDEPTSGLDSLTCFRTVKVLRDLVEASRRASINMASPMSIILTIHQPHVEVLELFHSVYVMAVGGQTLFQGLPGEMETLINEHSSLKMPTEGYNPASFMVELASEKYGRKPIDCLVEIQRKRFLRSATGSKIESSSSSSSSFYNHTSGSLAGSRITLYPFDDPLTSSTYSDHPNNVACPLGSSIRDIDARIMTPRGGANSQGVLWAHIWLMTRRCFLANKRDPLFCMIRIGAHIFIPLVVALIYGPNMGIPNGCPQYQTEIDLLEYATNGLDGIKDANNNLRVQFQNVGLHFMVYYAFALCMLSFTAISFPLIIQVLIKEIRNGWYSLGAYLVGKTLAELPMALLLPPISIAIIYLMTGQPSSNYEWRYMVQSLILILVVLITEAKGLIFGAVCMDSMQTAVFAASLSTVPLILLSGFLIRIREIPHALQQVAKLSYFKYSVEALIITRYGFDMCPCEPGLISAGAGAIPRIVGLPPQVLSLTDYYINSPANRSTLPLGSVEGIVNASNNNESIAKVVEPTTTTTTMTATGVVETTAMDNDSTLEEYMNKEPTRQSVFYEKLAILLTRANAFGYNIESCSDIEPFTMKDMRLKDDQLSPTLAYLCLTIVVLKLASYFIVEMCIRHKL